ncbi:MAG: TolB-like translocation protein, partial [Solirubrobacteraceae bacterium]
GRIRVGCSWSWGRWMRLNVAVCVLSGLFFAMACPVLALPDGRQYELVTPVSKDAALLGALFNAEKTHIARNGERVMSPSVQCFAEAEGCGAVRQNTGDPYEFRHTGSGWIAAALAPPATLFESNTPWLSAVDTGHALFSVPLQGTLSDEYVLRDPGGAVEVVGPVAENTAFSTALANEPLDATADVSHIVYTARRRLWAFDEGAGEAQSLYEYVGRNQAAPTLVGVTGGAESHDLIGVCGTGIFKPFGALSEDGRMVYFGVDACEGGSGANVGVEVPADEVYARVDESRTVLISGRASTGCVSEACQTSTPRNADFQGASADGSRAFFTSPQQLTDTASEDAEGDGTNCRSAEPPATGCNLYESECPSHCEVPSARRLIDVSAGDSSGEGPRVQGVLAVAPSGAAVYFVAKGVLTETPNSEGELAQAGGLNLYGYINGSGGSEGHIDFIGQLSSSDTRQWNSGIGFANVTPDGRYLLFTSTRALTSDDTRPEGPPQLYRYDSQTESLIRISVGEEGYNEDGNTGIIGASIAPAKVSFNGNGGGGGVGPAMANPSISNDGSYIFFQSPDGLTPHALDDVPVNTVPEYAQNIYEYHEGHVSLISDGKDISERPQESVSAVELLGGSNSGADVFFTTADRLTSQDTNTQIDYYDAHQCSSETPCVAPPPAAAASCQEEECHTAAAATGTIPDAVTPAFNGPGNLPETPKTPGVTPGTLRIISHSCHHTKCDITVQISTSGQLTIRSPNTKPIRRTLTHSGTYRYTITLNNTAHLTLRHTSHLHTTIRITTTFTNSTHATKTLVLTTTR